MGGSLSLTVIAAGAVRRKRVLLRLTGSVTPMLF
jgi:hypothetical protein